MNSMVRGRDRDFLIQLRLDVMAETRYNIVRFLLQQKISTLGVCFPCGSAGKESARNAGDLGLIPGVGRSPGEGKGYPLQYSGLENSKNCIVVGLQSQTQLSDFHFTWCLNSFSFFWPCHAACGILVSQSGIELLSPALEAQRLNHWTTKEVPRSQFLNTHLQRKEPGLLKRNN